MPNIRSRYSDSTLLKDCHLVIQLFKSKRELVTRLNLQLEFEYKMYKDNALNKGDFPYRFRTALEFLISNKVIKDTEVHLTLDKERLNTFYEQV